MRKLALIAALWGLASPARAQMGAPGGFLPFAVTAPEASAAGAIGASTANGANAAANCYTHPQGRSGLQTECSYTPPVTPGQPPKR